MKYLKSFTIYESNWSIEQWMDYVKREISKYNILPLQVEKILAGKSEEIKMRIDSGESPILFTRDLISELELDGSRGSMAVRFNNPQPGETKYL